MKTNIKRINQFNLAAHNYLAENKGETKLAYTLKKVAKQCLPVLEKYNSDLEDIAINNASVDEKGNLLHLKNEADGEIIGYSYTPAAAIQRKKEATELFTSEKEYPITPHICKDIPTDLTEAHTEVFADFVIELVEEVEPE
jgi:hypothetical protein